VSPRGGGGPAEVGGAPAGEFLFCLLWPKMCSLPVVFFCFTLEFFCASPAVSVGALLVLVAPLGTEPGRPSPRERKHVFLFSFLAETVCLASVRGGTSRRALKQLGRTRRDWPACSRGRSITPTAHVARRVGRTARCVRCRQWGTRVSASDASGGRGRLGRPSRWCQAESAARTAPAVCHLHPRRPSPAGPR